MEMCSVYDDPAYANVVRELTDETHRLQAEVEDGTHTRIEAGYGPYQYRFRPPTMPLARPAMTMVLASLFAFGCVWNQV